MSPETLMVAGYAVFLALAAGFLDRLARHTHSRSERWRVAGFKYDHRLDTWHCSQGEPLHRVENDLALRLARYRARAQTCNACPVKPDCTSSDAGREVTRALDPWPHSEAGRFHRGICLVLLALAATLLAVELARHHSPAELALLGGLLVIVVASAARTAASFRATPANFPVAGRNA